RYRQQARPDAGPDGSGMDTAAARLNQRPYRGIESGADRRERKSVGKSGLQHGRAGQDRFYCSVRLMKPPSPVTHLKMPVRSAAFVLGLIAACPTSACIWDSDTLDRELKKFPGIEQVITGRFERNPPLYYEMRLKRASDEIRAHPDHLEAYDDAGASC